MELSILNTQKNMNNTNTSVKAEEKKLQLPRPPQPDHAVKCPRCDSGNTKFCYYNNYSLSQPRYFCKACRRYWTEGGTLRNVPVGGGCRKNKRSAKRVLESHRHHLLVQSQVENVLSGYHDDGLSNFSSGTGDSLSLAFARLQKQCDGNNNNQGFEFADSQNSVLGLHQQGPFFGNLLDHNNPPHQQIRSSTANLGFLSNFFQTQTTSSLANSQSLYNYGFEIGGGQNHQSHTQPLLPNNQVLSLSTMAETAGGFSLMSGLKQEMMCNNNNGLNHNRISNFWQMDCNNSSSDNNNNLLLGSNNNFGNGYEVAGGRESWNNTGLAATQSWPNLINSALM